MATKFDLTLLTPYNDFWFIFPVKQLACKADWAVWPRIRYMIFFSTFVFYSNALLFVVVARRSDIRSGYSNPTRSWGHNCVISRHRNRRIPQRWLWNPRTGVSLVSRYRILVLTPTYLLVKPKLKIPSRKLNRVLELDEKYETLDMNDMAERFTVFLSLYEHFSNGWHDCINSFLPGLYFFSTRRLWNFFT